MKSILAFSGSNSLASLNQQLVIAATKLATGVETTVISLRDFDIPMYSIDLELEGIPSEVHRLHTLFQAADGFIIACPEYNGAMPPVFKSTIDWLSRVEKKTFANKPTLVMSTSPGPRGGQTNHEYLSEVLMPRWGANVCATFRLGNFYEHFDSATHTVIDNASATALQAAVDTLINQL